jgi:hypothetical protein
MPGPVFAAGSLTYIADLNALSNATLTVQKKGVSYTAVRGFWDILTAAALSITLPASPAAGDLGRLSSSSASVTSATLLRNGNNIDSAAADLALSGTDKTLNVYWLYVDASIGYRIIQQGGAGGLAWGGVQTSAFTAVKNTVYALDASTFNVTMPASPSAGDQVTFFGTTDARGAITFLRNSSNINSAAADYTTGTNRFWITFIFVNSTVGWRQLGEEANIKAAPTISSGTLTLDARGGLVTTFDVALNAAITTLTLSNLPPSGVPYRFELIFTADGTARAVTWGASRKWPGGNAPTLTSTNTKKDRFAGMTIDADTTTLMSIIGQSY